jgi:hypothetical protein
LNTPAARISGLEIDGQGPNDAPILDIDMDRTAIRQVGVSGNTVLQLQSMAPGGHADSVHQLPEPDDVLVRPHSGGLEVLQCIDDDRIVRIRFQHGERCVYRAKHHFRIRRLMHAPPRAHFSIGKGEMSRDGVVFEAQLDHAVFLSQMLPHSRVLARSLPDHHRQSQQNAAQQCGLHYVSFSRLRSVDAGRSKLRLI